SIRSVRHLLVRERSRIEDQPTVHQAGREPGGRPGELGPEDAPRPPDRHGGALDGGGDSPLLQAPGETGGAFLALLSRPAHAISSLQGAARPGAMAGKRSSPSPWISR